MSVVVRGMDIPGSCTECPFVIRDKWVEYNREEDSQTIYYIYNCIYKPDEIEDGWIRFREADRKRQDFCPIEEIRTPHSRLIDAEATEENMLLDMCGTGFQQRALDTIRMMSTIVEEEKYEDYENS